MNEIREALAESDTEAAALIRPTCFAEQEDLMGLEIGNIGQGRVHQSVARDLERVEGRRGPTCRLMTEPSNPNLLLF